MNRRELLKTGFAVASAALIPSIVFAEYKETNRIVKIGLNSTRENLIGEARIYTKQGSNWMLEDYIIVDHSRCCNRARMVAHLRREAKCGKWAETRHKHKAGITEITFVG